MVSLGAVGTGPGWLGCGGPFDCSGLHSGWLSPLLSLLGKALPLQKSPVAFNSVGSLGINEGGSRTVKGLEG